jgi:hypothetical protein
MMDTARAAHFARIRHLRESFAEANERLVARLRRADEHAAQQAPAQGAWSAAQIGLHVAKVTASFADLMSGDAPGAGPLPEGFHERDWAREIVPRIPPQLKASPRFEPPPHATRDAAVAALESAGLRMARALDTVTAERGAGHGLNHPLVGGYISLYQLGEWATAHVIRHNRQAKRALGEG